MPIKNVKDMEEIIKKTKETVCHACILPILKSMMITSHFLIKSKWTFFRQYISLILHILFYSNGLA